MASKDELVRMMGLTTPETMPEAALDDDGVTGVDLTPSDDALAAGIAAVFDSIRNGSGGESDAVGDEPDDGDDDGAVEDSGITFALLTELNRLWERPPV